MAGGLANGKPQSFTARGPDISGVLDLSWWSRSKDPMKLWRLKITSQPDLNFKSTLQSQNVKYIQKNRLSYIHRWSGRRAGVRAPSDNYQL